MDEEIRQALNEVREMKQMCGNINMKLTNIVTQRGQDFKKKLEAEYQRGFEDGQAVNDKGCEGCKYRGTIGMPPCIHCCNNFPNAWKKQDDKPIIGEVVERYLNGKRDGVGMFLGEDGDYWNCLFWTGAIFGTFAYPSNQFKRTGNVCDIEKILEAMEA